MWKLLAGLQNAPIIFPDQLGPVGKWITQKVFSLNIPHIQQTRARAKTVGCVRLSCRLCDFHYKMVFFNRTATLFHKVYIIRPFLNSSPCP